MTEIYRVESLFLSHSELRLSSIFAMNIFQVLIDHMEEQNVDCFTEAVKDYDSISRLDQWYTTILLRIKKQVNDNPDLR